MTRTHEIAAARRMARTGEARRLRLGAQLSLADVAQAAGVSRSNVARWEAGSRKVGNVHATRYAELLAALTEGT